MSQLPLAVVFSGPNQQSIEFALKSVESAADEVDLGYVRSKQKKFKFDEAFRGVLIIVNGEVVFKKIAKVRRRPLFIFIGSVTTEWIGMGTVLQKIPLFKRALDSCAKVLAKEDFDLMARFNSKVPDFAFENDLVKFVQVNVIHNCLIDIIRGVGVECDYFLGQSLGEHGAMYMNGATIEQSVMSVYLRVKALDDEKAPKGFLALLHCAQGEVQLPEGVRNLIYFLPGVILIGGLADRLPALQEAVDSTGAVVQIIVPHTYLYHHRELAPVSDDLYQNLDVLFGEGLQRSSKWISGVFEKGSLDESSRRANADYIRSVHLRPVLFTHAFEQIPKNVVMVEIGPDRTLSDIVSVAIGPSAKVIQMMKRDTTEDEAQLFIFESLANLLLEGQDIDLTKLYD